MLTEGLGNVSKACEIVGYRRPQFSKSRRRSRLRVGGRLVESTAGYMGPHQHRVLGVAERGAATGSAEVTVRLMAGHTEAVRSRRGAVPLVAGRGGVAPGLRQRRAPHERGPSIGPAVPPRAPPTAPVPGSVAEVCVRGEDPLHFDRAQPLLQRAPLHFLCA